MTISELMLYTRTTHSNIGRTYDHLFYLFYFILLIQNRTHLFTFIYPYLNLMQLHIYYNIKIIIVNHE